MTTQQDQEREALIERLREQLPKVGERETVWCQVRGDDLRATVEALAQQAEPQRVGMSRDQIEKIMTEHYPLSSLLREEVDAFMACVRDIERAHGIKDPT